MSKTKLDARHYEWKKLNNRNNVFAHLVQRADAPKSTGEVFFDEETFEQMNWSTNGVSFSYYSEGSIEQYAAVSLDNGKILFCVVSGSQFAGTFDSADDIRMQYYELTKLK